MANEDSLEDDLNAKKVESMLASDSASISPFENESFVQTSLSIPDKRYFTIGEVSELCEIKSHVLRYWEQEFEQLNPVKRKGNRRYYQKSDIVLIQEICKLLYLEGFTISGAKQRLNNKSNDELNPITELLKELQNIKILLSE